MVRRGEYSAPLLRIFSAIGLLYIVKGLIPFPFHALCSLSLCLYLSLLSESHGLYRPAWLHHRHSAKALAMALSLAWLSLRLWHDIDYMDPQTISE